MSQTTTGNGVNFCPSCGSAVLEGANFCARCGTSLEGAAHVAQPEVSLPPEVAPPPVEVASEPWVEVPPKQPPANGFAVASLVFGILWLYWIGSVLALVFGYIAQRQIKESNGAEGGEGLARAGMILGWIGIGAIVFIILTIIAHDATRP
jgi:hypothetical protein